MEALGGGGARPTLPSEELGDSSPVCFVLEDTLLASGCTHTSRAGPDTNTSLK